LSSSTIFISWLTEKLSIGVPAAADARKPMSPVSLGLINPQELVYSHAIQQRTGVRKYSDSNEKYLQIY
jgi:hypothetical protein